MKHVRPAFILLFLLCGTFSFSFAHANQAPAASRGHAIEITYFKGRPFAYQRVGEWTWYGAFALTPDWKLKMGEPVVQAVKLYSRDEAGSVKVKVTVLRGTNHEVENLVAEYTIGEKTTVVDGLANLGIVPFEIRLVRAPSTVAELPMIKNTTKSLVVGVEPSSSTLPTFKATIVNGSAKPVTGFAWRTSINDVTKLSGMPQDRKGGTLIAPGATHSQIIRYPMNLTTVSTGEVPQAQAGLQLNVTAVMFADGSWEGDRVEAARLRAYKLGEKIQLARILTLFRSASAATQETLALKVDELTYKIYRSDVSELAAEFPGFPESEVENLRSAAQVASSEIQKSNRESFGKGSAIDPKIFGDAVKGMILRCENRLNTLP